MSVASPFLVTSRATLTGHRDCLYALTTAATDVLYSAGADGLVVGWHPHAPDPDATGQVVAQVDGSIYALAYRAATHHLLIGHNRQGVQVIDLENRAVVRAPALGAAPIFDIAVSEALGRAWVALGDGTLAELDLATYAVRRTVRLSGAPLRAVAVSAARGEVIVTGSDHRVRVLDADSLALKQELPGHTNSVFTAVFSPDEALLVTAGRDAHLRHWQAGPGGYELTHSVVAHLFTIHHVAFSPDGAVFASASMDKSIKLWSARTGRLLHVLRRAAGVGHGTSINRLAWLPAAEGQPSLLASASDDRTVGLWEVGLRL